LLTSESEISSKGGVNIKLNSHRFGFHGAQRRKLTTCCKYIMAFKIPRRENTSHGIISLPKQR